MRWLLALSVLIGAAALPPNAARGQSTIAATAVEHTTFGEVSARTLADHWGLQPDEIAQYRDYMAVEGRYFYSHLDPVMVLGLIETEPARRARYAEKYVLAERRRIEQQTGFATLVAAVQLKRFGLEPPVDFARLPQAQNSPAYGQARAERLNPRPASPALSPPVVPPAEPVSLRAGDTVDLLVTAGCETPCYDQLSEVLKTPGVKVHLYGRGFQDTPALVAWLERWPAAGLAAAARAAAAARIEPRRYDAVVFAGIDVARPPVALLRRQGAVIGTL